MDDKTLHKDRSNTFNKDVQLVREWYIDIAKDKDWSHRVMDLSTQAEIAALLTVIGRDVRELVEANEHYNRTMPTMEVE